VLRYVRAHSAYSMRVSYVRVCAHACTHRAYYELLMPLWRLHNRCLGCAWRCRSVCDIHGLLFVRHSYFLRGWVRVTTTYRAHLGTTHNSQLTAHNRSRFATSLFQNSSQSACTHKGASVASYLHLPTARPENRNLAYRCAEQRSIHERAVKGS
jgi:Fe-S-cluster-containing hydrogenase component 2